MIGATSVPSGTGLSNFRMTRIFNAHVVRLFAVAGIVTAWQFLPGDIVPEFAIGRPVDAAHQLWVIFSTAKIWPHLWATTYTASLGLVIAAPMGTILAIARQLAPVRWFLDPFVAAGNAVPKVALTSLFILFLGISIRAHVVLVVSFAVFVFFYNMRQALLEVDVDRLMALRLLGASRVQILWMLVLPSSLPYLLAALRVATPMCYAAALFAELRIPSLDGLGSLLSQFATSFNAPGAVAVMLLVASIGYMLDLGIGRLLQGYVRGVGLTVRL
jgi:NitT/TauT family transport system permease protein